MDFPWNLGHSDSVLCTFSFSVIEDIKPGIHLLFKQLVVWGLAAWIHGIPL